MQPIRVLLVDDSLTVRKRLREVIDGDDGMEVVGEAGTGQEAVELCHALRPDLVTMDMALPVMSGLEATEQIMARCPTPILIVSSSTNRGELYGMYEALAAGAVDVLEKPSPDDDGWEATLLARAKLVSKIRVITHPRGLRTQPRSDDHRPARTGAVPRSRADVVAIGASTGGPGAVAQLLRDLPQGLAVPVLLVLHIGVAFASALSDWLADVTGRTVRPARDGELLAGARGQVVMAPPDRHLLVEGSRVRLSAAPERHSCRPSVDVLFESLARSHGATTVACLLTGMGRDGAAGLLAIRRAGGLTIAQDEATSVVYGMPREAVLIGGAGRVLPIGDIAPAVAEAVAAPRAGGARP